MNQDENKVVEDVQVEEVPVEKTELELAIERAQKAEEERDNYKTVALKRLGKLPGDAEFLDKEGEGLSVAEQIRLALLDKEVEAANRAKDEANAKLIKENAELRLALKNRPGASVGSDSGSSSETKDNTFSSAQLEDLRKRALRLKADPEKFIQAAKDNLARRS